MSEGFKIGDVVYVKCGGPAMTVEHVEGDLVACIWFDERNMLQSARLKAELLEHASSEG